MLFLLDWSVVLECRVADLRYILTCKVIGARFTERKYM